MSKRKRFPYRKNVTRIWQHLEFFQWFAREMGAERLRDWHHPQMGSTPSVARITPHGVGLAYSRERGIELIELRQYGWVPCFYIRLMGSQKYFDPASIPALTDRLTFYQNTEPAAGVDLRKLTMLKAILSYQPNPLHPHLR